MVESAADAAELGLGRLFDLAPDAVIVGDALTGRIVRWNRAAEEVFGYTAREAVGMPLVRIVADELVGPLEAGIARYRQEGRIQLVDSQRLTEIKGKHKNGSLVWLELRLARLEPSASEVRPILAIARDVTGRKRAEEQAARDAQELEAAHRALREFVAIAAHDLRGPLGIVSSAVKMLETMALGPEERSELLSIADRQTALMARLLDELVDINQIESGQLLVRASVFPLGQAVEDSLGLAEGPVSVTVPEHLLVRADPAHVTRVVNNLLTNARRYGAEPFVITADRAGVTVELRVRDSGPGLAPEVAESMFSKFTRGDRSTGLGLGLAISRGLAEANGGSLLWDADDPGAAASCSGCRPPSAPERGRTGPVQIGVVFPQTEIGAGPGRGPGLRRGGRGGSGTPTCWPTTTCSAPTRPCTRAGRVPTTYETHVPRAVRALRVPGRRHLARAGHRDHHPPPAPDRPGGQAGGRGRPAHRRATSASASASAGTPSSTRPWARTSPTGAGGSASRSSCCADCGPSRSSPSTGGTTR